MARPLPPVAKNIKYIFVGPALERHLWPWPTCGLCVAGTEPILAMGLAACVVEDGRDRSAWPGFAEFAAFVKKNYAVETVAGITGVSADIIKGLAKELSTAGQPLVLTAASAGFGLGAMEAAAGMNLNMLLGRVNTSGGVRILPWNPSVVKTAADMKTRLGKDVVAYLTAVADGSVTAPALLLVHSAVRPMLCPT